MKKIKRKATKYLSFVLALMMAVGVLLPYLPPLHVEASVSSTALTVTQSSPQTATFTHKHAVAGSAVTNKKIQANSTVSGRTAQSACYSTSVIHSHEGNTTSGGACYDPTYHTHTTACHTIKYHQHADSCKEYKARYSYVFVGSDTYYERGRTFGYCPYCGHAIISRHTQVINGVRYTAYSDLDYGFGGNVNGREDSPHVKTGVWYDNKTGSYVTMPDCYNGGTSICTYACCCNGATGGGYFSNAGTANHMPSDAVLKSGTIKYWSGNYICGKTTSTVESDTITCGKSTTTVVGYHLKGTDPYYTSRVWTQSCGIAEGAVTAKATVSADSDNKLTLTMSNVNAKTSYTVTWTKPDGTTVNGGTTLQCDTLGTYKCTVNVKTTINGSVVDNDTAVFNYNAVPKATSVKFFDYYRMPEYPNNVPTNPFYTMSMTKGNVGSNAKMTAYPTYTGYNFLGIYTGTDTSSTRVFDENGQYLGDDSFLPLNGGTVNLYCLYAPKDITITYDTHNTNGLYDSDMGVEISGRFHTGVDTPDVKTDTFTYDTANATLSNQAKTYEGYTFEGWYDNVTGSGSYPWWMNGWMPYNGTGNKIFDANGLVAQTGKHKGTGSTLQHILKLSEDTTLYPRYTPNAYTLYYYTDKANTQLASKTVYYDAPVEVTYYDWRDYSVEHYQSVPSSYQNYYNFTATGGSVDRNNNDVGFVADGCEYVEGYYFDGWDWEDTGNPAVRPWFNNPTGGSYYDTSLNDSAVEANGNSKLWKWDYDRTLVTVYKPNHYGLRYCDRILNRDGNGDLVDPEVMESLPTGWDSNNNPSGNEDFIKTQYADVVYDGTDNFAGTIREYEGYTLDGYYGVLYFPYGSPQDYGRTWIIDGQQYRINPCDYYGHGWNNQRHTYENRVIDVMTGDASNLPAHEIPDSYTPHTIETPEKELLSRVDGSDETPPVNLTKLTKWVGKVYNADGTLVDGKWNILFDTNIYPRYTPNHYTLSINFDKDSNLEPRDMTYNEIYGLTDEDKASVTPYRGYTFNGWFDDDLGQIFDENGENTNGNLWKYLQDVNAKATYSANPYVVHYNTEENKTPDNDLDVVFDDPYRIPEDDVEKVPEKDGYTFVGWFDEETGEKIFNEDGTSVDDVYDFDKDITVVVKYSNNPINVKISTETDRKVNDNGIGKKSEYEYDITERVEYYDLGYGKIEVPTKRGYDFTGYVVNPLNNGEKTYIWNADGKPSEELFRWLPVVGDSVLVTSTFKPSTIKGDIDAKKYDPKTDTESDNPIHIEEVYDEPYDKLPHLPEKEGYDYEGITDKDGNPVYDKDGNLVQDVWQYTEDDIKEFIIKWTPKWYVLVYDNGKEQKIYFDKEVPDIGTMSKDGHTFGGYSFDYFGKETFIINGSGHYTAEKWTYDVGKSGTKIPLKDLWDVNHYIVTVKLDDGTSYPVTVTYDMAYNNVTIPTKTGYVFNGFDTEYNSSYPSEYSTAFWNSDGTPSLDRYTYTHDISVLVKWKPKTYYLHMDDTVITVTYDDIIRGNAPIKIKGEDKDGNKIYEYDFKGWFYNDIPIFDANGKPILSRWNIDAGPDGTHIYLSDGFDESETIIETPKEIIEEPEEITEVNVEPIPNNPGKDIGKPIIRKIIETVMYTVISILFLIVLGLFLFWLLFFFGEITLVYRYNERKSEKKGKPVQTLDGIFLIKRYKKKDRVEDTKHYVDLEKVLFRGKDRYYHMLLDTNADMVSLKFGWLFRNVFYKNTDVIVLCNDVYNKYRLGRKDKNKGDLEKGGKLMLHLSKKFGDEDGDYVYLPPKSTETRKYY